jgi:nitrite reductase (cytochrome c-552)
MTGQERRQPPNGRKWQLWAAAAAAVGLAGTLGAASLLTNIAQRKAEARVPFFQVVQLNDTIEDPAVWGKNYPIHYGDYLKTGEMVPTKHGGSYAVYRDSTADDPRTVVSYSKIEKDPRLARMWSGYAFSVDFREERGHIYNFIDQVYTKRQQFVKQPGTCLNCHASTYVPMMRLGEGDLTRGFERMNSMPYVDAKDNIRHPVTCIDCHNPQNMELRITRPGLMEALTTLKAREGIRNYDVNRDASRTEMRTYVCAQCHVEYYFKGDEKRLVFPWQKGLQADSIMAYFDEIGFRDWTHKETGAATVKAQHPEFELYSQGIHARSGVACADCHMPMKREGAMKISDHHVRSPLLDVNRSCQTCHRASEGELVARVEQIQDRHVEMVSRALDALMALIDDLSRAAAVEGESDRVKQAREMHRKASWYVDFVEAENSVGFHAPQEAARLLGMSIDYSRQGQLILTGATLRGSPVQRANATPAPAPVQPAARPAAQPGARPAAGRTGGVMGAGAASRTSRGTGSR